jgi:hypothetical protein
MEMVGVVLNQLLLRLFLRLNLVVLLVSIPQLVNLMELLAVAYRGAKLTCPIPLASSSK